MVLFLASFFVIYLPMGVHDYRSFVLVIIIKKEKKEEKEFAYGFPLMDKKLVDKYGRTVEMAIVMNISTQMHPRHSSQQHLEVKNFDYIGVRLL